VAKTNPQSPTFYETSEGKEGLGQREECKERGRGIWIARQGKRMRMKKRRKGRCSADISHRKGLCTSLKSQKNQRGKWPASELRALNYSCPLLLRKEVGGT